jgi:lipopolysaccharide transport system permease protein
MIASQPSRSFETTEIAPPSGWGLARVWVELWRHAELLGFLVWREVRIRYAQTILGVGWAVLQPLVTMAIFAVVFGRFARIPSDGVPYAIFALVGVATWTYLSTAVTSASASLVTNASLVTRVYFPRLAMPLASTLSALVDLGIALVLLLAAMALVGIVPGSLAAVLVPLAILALLLFAGGLGMLLAALNVQYRDVRYIVPFLLQVLMYASPVVYPLSLVPERYRWAFMVNPLTGVIEALRSGLLGTIPAAEALPLLASSFAGGIALFLVGSAYFARTERSFADVA